MKKLMLILLLLPGVARAQSDTVRVAQTVDSLQQQFTGTSDSLKQAYATQTHKLVSLKQRYAAKLDSVKSKRPSTPVNPLDTLHAPDAEVYAKKIDSVDRQLENTQRTTTAKLDSLKGRVTEQLGKLKIPKEAEGKVAGLTVAMDKVNVPAFDAELPNMPGMPGTGNLPGVNLPGTNLSDVNTTLPNANINAPDLKNNLPDINTGKLNETVGQAGTVQQQVQSATGSVDGLGNTLESKAGEQVKGLPDQKLPDVADMPGGVPQNGDAMKEQLTQLAQKEAVNHFAGKEAVLTNAMEKMGKYKQKYSSVSSLADIKDEKRHNELKGKPLRERLVPALTLQFQSWEDWMLDINPSVGYKITSHITAGIGWNQRVAFNIPQQQFNEEAKVYGIRSYGEYTFKKGFGFRLDIETMNTPAKKKDPATDVNPARDWVWGALVGIKQKYPIYKKLKGNAQLMYNMFDKDHRSPYLDRVNFRIGVEFTMKQKKKAASEGVSR